MGPQLKRRVRALEAKAFSSSEPGEKRLAFPAEILEGWQAQGMEFDPCDVDSVRRAIAEFIKRNQEEQRAKASEPSAPNPADDRPGSEQPPEILEYLRPQPSPGQHSRPSGSEGGQNSGAPRPELKLRFD
jgi:hypothetical protein